MLSVGLEHRKKGDHFADTTLAYLDVSWVDRAKQLGETCDCDGTNFCPNAVEEKSFLKMLDGAF